ncbi:predicted protein [Chaetomium globosum CBS 148.51]|uniref:Uncharacterized protein n=1 Tax=Chaetomium globosum (strain ATCC 6205 / CBS 148.51 / DSM 1962 / NBRC 6347 / NRRL 1970) TaxID=306901 RepID=Q2HBX8_CHAGB|nr:uncharacterized protein CHGG_02276 [Chaetomium globosum CBS 148.51]EAQ90341.1 predicted protein [Chaetomium globosum CBS 148.51]
MVSPISASPHKFRGAFYEPITPSEEESAPDNPLTENRDTDIEGQKVNIETPGPNVEGEGGRRKAPLLKHMNPELYEQKREQVCCMGWRHRPYRQVNWVEQPSGSGRAVIVPDYSTQHKCRSFERILRWADDHAAPEAEPLPELKRELSVGAYGWWDDDVRSWVAHAYVPDDVIMCLGYLTQLGRGAGGGMTVQGIHDSAA